jgi:hypothetical protein
MGGPRVGIVSETLARHVWPNGGAVGRMITVGSDRVEVVGAVKALQWTSALQQTGPGCVSELLAGRVTNARAGHPKAVYNFRTAARHSIAPSASKRLIVNGLRGLMLRRP